MGNASYRYDPVTSRRYFAFRYTLGKNKYLEKKMLSRRWNSAKLSDDPLEGCGIDVEAFRCNLMMPNERIEL